VFSEQVQRRIGALDFREAQFFRRKVDRSQLAASVVDLEVVGFTRVEQEARRCEVGCASDLVGNAIFLEWTRIAEVIDAGLQRAVGEFRSKPRISSSW
jgi:hypothetical protein